MFLELHILQNFAPSNLNRDDTGAPKDCEFGGYRRARISSQCLKRAVRREFARDGLFPPDQLASRTKRLLDELTRVLTEDYGRDKAAATTAVGMALRGVGFTPDEDGRTQYLLFLGRDEIRRLAGLVNEHLDSLAGAPPAESPEPAAGKKKASAKDKKKADKAALSSDLKKALEEALDGGKAVDLALFGRMLADMPDRNIDAACQVAHALSANKVSMEMDYYTAVDDLKPEDTAGADMIGTVEFNSSCFYRYASIDLGQLTKNLRGDEELARRAAVAFLEASVAAVPTGKQNTFAAHNPPSLVFAVVRDRGQWSLANAFVQPVRPSATRDLVTSAAEALDAYWGRLTAAYGTEGIRSKAVLLLHEAGLEHLAGDRVKNAEDLYQRVAQALGCKQTEAAP